VTQSKQTWPKPHPLTSKINSVFHIQQIVNSIHFTKHKIQINKSTRNKPLNERYQKATSLLIKPQKLQINQSCIHISHNILFINKILIKKNKIGNEKRNWHSSGDTTSDEWLADAGESVAGSLDDAFSGELGLLGEVDDGGDGGFPSLHILRSHIGKSIV